MIELTMNVKLSFDTISDDPAKRVFTFNNESEMLKFFSEIELVKDAITVREDSVYQEFYQNGKLVNEFCIGSIRMLAV